MQVEITPELQALIEDLIRSRRYFNPEEVIEEAINQLWDHNRAEDRALLRMQRAVEEGLASADRGECEPLDFSELKKRLHAEFKQRHPDRI